MKPKDATARQQTTEEAANLDPITGEPGAHPLGAGVGAAGGGAAGAALGSLAGPVGTVVGAIVGGLAGGYAGKSVAEGIDPTVEETYWRGAHGTQTYAQGRDYSAYEPAYRTGISRYEDGRTFDEIEDDLRRDYEATRGEGSRREDATAAQLEWEDARHATRAAYERLASRRGTTSGAASD